MALLSTLVIFLLANTVPGDPVLAQLGDLAASNKEFVAEWRAKWGLDLPLWERYLIFLQRPAARRPRHLDRLAAPGAAGYPRFCAGDAGAGEHCIPACARRRHPAGHHGGGAPRQLDRSSGAADLAHRRFLTDVLARLHHACAVLWRAADRAGARAPRRHRTSASVHHRPLPDRQRACRRLGYVSRCARAPGPAVDRAGGGDARADHANDARQHAGKHAAGLCAGCARQGLPRTPHRDRPHPAERPDPGRDARRPGLCQPAHRRGADRDDFLLARAWPLHLPQRRLARLSRPSWASR